MHAAILQAAASMRTYLSMLKEGTRAVIEKDSYPVLPIFKLLAKTGDIEEKMMGQAPTHLGLGMVLAVDPMDVDKTSADNQGW